jgi:hypothetical protein
MKIWKHTLPFFLGLTALLLGGCERGFEDLNTNPNAPETVAPQFLLANILWEAADHNTRQGWLAGNLLAQHTANLEFLPADRYDLGTNTEYWNHLYRLLNDVEALNSASRGNEAYAGVGLVMRAWLASQLTDLWADVPYSEGLKGASAGNFTPAFDSQETIYLGEGGILDLLEKAAQLLENTDDKLAGDIMYGGDLVRWVRFANSLRVRYLLRISGQAAVSGELQKLVKRDKLMRSNADNAVVPYLAAAPNQWFIFTEREGRYTDLRMSTTIESALKSLNDPRLGTYFKPTAASAGNHAPVFKGIPNGLSRARQSAYNLSDVSLLGRVFRDVPNGFDAQLMQYSELQFALAEAAERGLLAGNPKEYYEEGIAAAFRYYNTPLPPLYLTDPAVALNGSNNLKKILTQAWLALIMNGHEAWFLVRRTGLPELTMPADNLNGDQYPVRYRYPESEQAVNGEHYSSAAARIGGDTYNSKGWWEKD